MVGRTSTSARASHSPARWLSVSTGAAVVGGAIPRAAQRRPPPHRRPRRRALARRGEGRGLRARTSRPARGGEDPYLLVRTEGAGGGRGGGDPGPRGRRLRERGPFAPRTILSARRWTRSSRPSARRTRSSCSWPTTARASWGPGGARGGRRPSLRARLRKGLADVRAGGASNLGLALERAADLLDGEGDRAGSGMVVYLGDGRPTVGESSARDLRKRLARRASGAPRLGALAVGQGADRWLLAEVVAGGGPAYDVLDRPDAACVSAALVADALAPTLRAMCPSTSARPSIASTCASPRAWRRGRPDPCGRPPPW